LFLCGADTLVREEFTVLGSCGTEKVWRPRPSRTNRPSEINRKINGSGQECPLYTSFPVFILC